MNMGRSLVDPPARNTSGRNIVQASGAGLAWEAPLCHATPCRGRLVEPAAKGLRPRQVAPTMRTVKASQLSSGPLCATWTGARDCIYGTGSIGESTESSAKRTACATHLLRWPAASRGWRNR